MFVVDNNSASIASDTLIDQYPFIEIEILSRNIGFAAANNYAINKLVTTQWVALINPDTVAKPDWFQIMIEQMNCNPGYGSYSGRLMNQREPDKLDGAGDVYHVSGLVWRNKHGRQLDQESQTCHEILSPCAASAIYESELFRTVGGFDEDYFCYLEDIDLGLRLQSIGKSSWYVGTAVMSHIGSAVTGRSSAFTVYHGHRNLVWTYIKNMPGGYIWRHLPQHLLMTLVTLLFYSAKGQPITIWKSKIDALRGVRSALIKRRQCQNNRTISSRKMVGMMTRGWFRPYLKRNA